MKRALTLATAVAIALSYAGAADAQLRYAPKRPSKASVDTKAMDTMPNPFRKNRSAAPAAPAPAPVPADEPMEVAVAAPATTSAATLTAAAAPAAVPAAPVAPVADTAAAQQALTRLIGELQAGAPDYSKLEQRIADAMRGQQAALSGLINSKGALQAVEPIGADGNGAQKFRARFERDSTDFGLSLNAQGQISGFTITD